MKLTLLGIAAAVALATPALAYDGTNCKAPGNCWEPKPDYPETVEGSKYDPQHDPAEISKQGDSLAAMDERNQWRIWNMKQTGDFVYDVNKIPDYEEGSAPPSQ
ncbi:methanol dehydrogenase [Pontibaca methylaminivorans]|uniref:methanol dehydrogenase n=1 Tax=Pontibaca methylaminivorans TaxID=515897 RepID=UPI002FDA4909